MTSAVTIKPFQSTTVMIVLSTALGPRILSIPKVQLTLAKNRMVFCHLFDPRNAVASLTFAKITSRVIRSVIMKSNICKRHQLQDPTVYEYLDC